MMNGLTRNPQEQIVERKVICPGRISSLYVVGLLDVEKTIFLREVLLGESLLSSQLNKKSGSIPTREAAASLQYSPRSSILIFFLSASKGDACTGKILESGFLKYSYIQE